MTTLETVVQKALRDSPRIHLEAIVAHGIHNLTNDYADDADVYEAVALEFDRQARAALNADTTEE